MVISALLLVSMDSLFMRTFAPIKIKKSTMEIKSSYKEGLLDDEVIQYIAHRHHATANDVVDSCIEGDCMKVNLEDNEKNIIHDLIRMYNNIK